MEFYEQFLQYLITGLTMGSIYALLALGIVVVYKVTDILNLAQGEFVMLGALLMVSLQRSQLPPVATFILAVLLTTVAGAAIERIAIRPAKGASVITLINITLGVSISVRGLGLIAWGPDPFRVPAFSGEKPLSIGGAAIVPQSLWVLGATAVVLLGLYWFFERTIWGKALRACAMNARAARLMGISTSRMSLLSFALSASLGAIGGTVVAPITMASYDMGLMVIMKALVAALLGGLGSLPGAVAGGLLLGVLESTGAAYVRSGYKDAIAFIVLFLVLFLKPNGLFGNRSSGRGGI